MNRSGKTQALAKEIQAIANESYRTPTDNTLDVFDDRATRVLEDTTTTPNKMRRQDIQAMLERSRQQYREGFKP